MNIDCLANRHTDVDVTGLNVGYREAIPGTIYGAPPAAHKRAVELLDLGKPLPMDLRGGIRHYVGPTPAPPGRPIRSASPATSLRMDASAPRMCAYGMNATIGGGNRGQAVVDSDVMPKALCLVAVGGLGVTLAQCITSAKVIAYQELGTKALWRFQVENLPAIIANDTRGRNVFQEGQAVWVRRLAVAQRPVRGGCNPLRGRVQGTRRPTHCHSDR